MAGARHGRGSCGRWRREGSGPRSAKSGSMARKSRRPPRSSRRPPLACGRRARSHRAALLPPDQGVHRRPGQLGQRKQVVQKLQRREDEARAPARLVDFARNARARGARARLRPAGRAPLHRQGHQRSGGSSERRQHDGASVDTDTRRRRPPDRPRAARIQPRRRALPVRPARGDRAEPVRPRRRAVPDDVLRHLPPSRCRHLPPRGGRRRRALDAGGARRPRARREPRRGRRRAARRFAASSQPARPAATAARRSTSASAAPAAPGSLKCLHAHAAFALARPGYELGERIVAELDPLWPERCCTATPASIRRHVAARHDARPPGVGGRRSPPRGRARSDPRRYERLLAAGRDRHRRVAQAGRPDLLARRARRRLPRRRALGRARSSRSMPRPPGWPRDLSLVLAAAFYAYQRGATDYLS